jgi:hypothetical protein
VVKTTIELPDDLLADAKRLAAAKGETLKGILMMSLRRSLDLERGAAAQFRLRDASFTGRGLAKEMDWAEIRETIYEGRGA